MSGEWRVAAILNESLSDTMRFAAWYLAEGASSLLLMFDDPRDPAMDVLTAHPKIDCVGCTAGFWRDLGMSAISCMFSLAPSGATILPNRMIRALACGWLRPSSWGW